MALTMPKLGAVGGIAAGVIAPTVLEMLVGGAVSPFVEQPEIRAARAVQPSAGERFAQQRATAAQQRRLIHRYMTDPEFRVQFDMQMRAREAQQQSDQMAQAQASAPPTVPGRSTF